MNTYETYMERLSKVKLLDVTDPKYLRRMVKALNEHSFNGFYAFPTRSDGSGDRFNRARLHNGRLQITFASDEWRDAEGLTFSDPYGQNICASRHPKY